MNAHAFVMAAGFGTRLRPLTHHLPKPLVPVCGLPAIDYSLALCAQHGIDRVIVNAHYMADHIERLAGIRERVHVQVFTETPEILGTGGGLRNVMSQLADRVVVLNGDVLTDVDLRRLTRAVPDGGSALALRRHREDATRYGVVSTDTMGLVRRIRDYSDPEMTSVPVDTHFTGVHAFDTRVLDRLDPGPACIVGDVYMDLVRQERVHGIIHRGLWLDIGDPAAYLTANLAALHGSLPLPIDPINRAAWAKRGDLTLGDPTYITHTHVSGDVWVGHGAQTRGSYLHDTIIGRGAQVLPGTSLRRCVVWDDIVVESGSFVDCVFYTGGCHPLMSSNAAAAQAPQHRSEDPP